MNNVFDEISFQYWFENCKYIQAKSYSCFHNGYVYGDNMDYDEISFIYVDGNKEIKILADSPRKLYIKFVEFICNKSENIKHNFLTAKADKFKIFSSDEVANFTIKQRNSTRIKDENSAIVISNEKYYVANNLKLCEYFNAVANALTDDYRNKIFIRIEIKNEKRNNSLKAVDELQPMDEVSYENFKLIIENEDSVFKKQTSSKKTIKSSKTNYLSLYEKKKSIGDFGEYLVLEFEKKKLSSVGLDYLANKIEHTSHEVGDNEGYDIKSYTEDGDILYIEVKSTQQNTSGGFYISQNEIDIAKKFYSEGKIYKIYRLYKINKRKGEASLKIYTPPFDNDHYNMSPISWFVDDEK